LRLSRSRIPIGARAISNPLIWFELLRRSVNYLQNSVLIDGNIYKKIRIFQILIRKLTDSA
jgi:hypothetical protein